MPQFIIVNGAKIEKQFLEENVTEAKTYQWKQALWKPSKNDHTHCIICTITIPEKPIVENTIYYESNGGWLCNYCYERFIHE